MSIFSKLFGKPAPETYVDPRLEQEAQRVRNIHDALIGPHGDNAHLYAATVQLVKNANFPTPEEFREALVPQFLDACKDILPYRPHVEIMFDMMSAAKLFYIAERMAEIPEYYPGHVTSGEAGEYRQRLLAQQKKCVNAEKTLQLLSTVCIECFLIITRNLPPIARVPIDGTDIQLDDASTTVPLIDILPNVGKIISSALKPFDSKPAQELGLFQYFHNRLNENIEKLQGNSKRVPTPEDFEGSAQETVEAFLHDALIEDIFLQPHVPWALADEARFSGHWIIAPAGRGKTTLLHSMVMEDLEKDAAVILMDSKGDLIDPIRNLKSIEDRLIIIDPDPLNPVAINPLDIPKTDIAHAVSHLEYIFSSLLEVKMTPLQTVLFRSVLRALITTFPNPTFDTFRDIIANGFEKYDAHIKQLPQDLQDFFYKEFNTKTYQDRRPEIIWRIRLLLENEAMRGMLLATRTRFNIGAAMNAGKVIVINNSKALLGDQGAEFFGRFFIAQVLAAAQVRSGRAAHEKKPVYFYIDECHNVISRDEKIPTILDECRSQKVALILAHQRTNQIASANVLDALANCAVRYANSDDEARYLAPRLRTSMEVLQSLQRGEFAAFVRDMTTHALALTILPVDFSALPKLSTAEQHALKARMRAEYGVQTPPPVPSAAGVVEPQLDSSAAIRDMGDAGSLPVTPQGRAAAAVPAVPDAANNVVEVMKENETPKDTNGGTSGWR